MAVRRVLTIFGPGEVLTDHVILNGYAWVLVDGMNWPLLFRKESLRPVVRLVVDNTVSEEVA